MDWVDLFCRLGRHAGGGDGSARAAAARAQPLLAGVVFFPVDEPALDAVEAWRAHAAACWSISTRLARIAARALPRNPARGRRRAAHRAGTAIRRRSRKWTRGSTVSKPPAVCSKAPGSPLAPSDRERFRRIPPLAAGVGERHRPPQRRAQNEYRLRRAAGRQSRDAGLLPAPSWTPNFPAATSSSATSATRTSTSISSPTPPIPPMPRKSWPAWRGKRSPWAARFPPSTGSESAKPTCWKFSTRRSRLQRCRRSSGGSIRRESWDAGRFSRRGSRNRRSGSSDGTTEQLVLRVDNITPLRPGDKKDKWRRLA